MADAADGDARAAALARYAAWFEGLSPETLPLMETLTSPDVRFRDPFNDIIGRDGFRRVFEDMFERTHEPSFAVTDQALGGAAGYLRWTMTFRPRGSKRLWTIVGMSEVHIDDNGRITAHLDHWDCGRQFYEKLPVVGWIVRLVARRLRV